MGRHSAPDDDDTANAAASAAGSSATTTTPAQDESVGTGPASAHQSGTHADLQMLRENPALRARCIAAAVVPFLLYTVVLVVVGRADLYLVWVWIPIVLAGILVGTMLDLGHRSARRSPSD